MTDKHVHAAHTHTAHADVVKRLKRANGHLSTVIAMIEAQRPCIDIAQQLHAVERAVGNAKKVFVGQDGLSPHLPRPLPKKKRPSCISGRPWRTAWRLRMSAY
ncbi:MAG: hypothetical protein B7Y03_15625 [Polaromonas sp. 24-62-144]|nr:MAG: hypothetical protein B7Y03_15625 [Polaromonas sp. 24-62-144]